MTVGYHADASSLAPKGWLTGSEWNWGPLYTDIVKTVARRQLHRQQVQRQLPGRLQDRRQPVRRSRRTARRHRRHAGADRGRPRTKLGTDELAVRRADHRPGRHRRWSRTATIPTVRRPSSAMDYFVQGVVGNAPDPVPGSGTAPTRPVPVRALMHVTGTTPYAWPWDGDLRGRRHRAGSSCCRWVLDVAARRRGRLAAAVRAAGGAVDRRAHHGRPRPAHSARRRMPVGGRRPASPTWTVTAGGVDGFYGSPLDARCCPGRIGACCSPGSGSRPACTPRCAPPTTAATSACWCSTPARRIDPALVRRGPVEIEMSGGIFGAVGTTADVLRRPRHRTDVRSPAMTTS